MEAFRPEHRGTFAVKVQRSLRRVSSIGRRNRNKAEPSGLLYFDRTCSVPLHAADVVIGDVAGGTLQQNCRKFTHSRSESHRNGKAASLRLEVDVGVQ